MRIAIIPARGGSVRIPRKNIRDFKGKPMMQWPIEAAKASGLFDLIVVSTDDDEIEALAHGLGCVVHQRAQDDDAKGTQEVAAAVVEHFGFRGDTDVCTIYPCSPLLTADMLRDAVEVWDEEAWMPLVSTYPGEQRDAGCFYLQRADDLLDDTQHVWRTATMAWPLPADRCIDINTPEDLAKAESMYDALHRL